ncbi:hypothetical protein MBLNU457_6628t1 [Dothideomycetes sp. NU457]
MPPTSAARKTQTAVDPNRRQSGRQVRTSISRPLNYYARPYGSIGGNVDESQDDSPPGFFPAIQYFTDAITALPKETMRHFTLMKEVEAKIHGPSQSMTQLSDRILNMPVPPRRNRQPSRQALLSFTANNSSAATSANPSVVNGAMPPPPLQQASEADDQVSQATQFDSPVEIARRQDFQNLRAVIHSVLINLDEKNVCLSEANKTLDKQLARVEGVLPHVESEISEEARLGNLKHWAYADNRVKHKPAPANAERNRRDVAATNSLAAAAATVHEDDIAAARGEARREAKKRHQQADSEFEDRTTKKAQGKGRKAAEAASQPATAAKGLGIVNGLPTVQPPKRRRVDKDGPVAMERTLSGTGKGNKGAGNVSRSTPAVEAAKKKTTKASAPPPVATKKKNAANSPQQSPRMSPSPLVANFAQSNDLTRPTSTRMRQTSSTLQYSTLANEEARPSSSAGIKTTNGDRAKRASVSKAKEPPQEQEQEQRDHMDIDGANEKTTQPTIESVADVKKDEDVGNEETGGDMPRSASRASKMVTPNPDYESIIMSRMRNNGARSAEPSVIGQRTSSRNGEGRSHSRNGSNHILKQIASFNRSPVSARRANVDEDDDDEEDDSDSPEEDPEVPRTKRRATSRRNRAETPDEEPPAPAETEEVNDEVEDEEEENDHDPDDPNEPKYCYCGRGSYGQMIACDNPNCKKEWFHLECTGLKTAPADSGAYLESPSLTESFANISQYNGSAMIVIQK